ncbi:NF-kappa-B inhibitor delta [Sphaerodactylus townsendi]|uniref:NF-kappa-B inhibitor delta n=1 Tax=Sphaerodactylus townsendi TaxID=933632 RepID=UPI00202611F4|nr:NF-kappa-B inhibitor delta [Sphaerodactylus townsendi]
MATEASQPAEPPFLESPGATEGRGPTPGQTAVPEYPVSAFPSWQPDAPGQTAFPDCHYHYLDTKNYHVQPVGPVYNMMNPFPSMEAGIYGSTGPGGAEEAYGSKMTPVLDYEKSVSEPQALNLYPLPGGIWMEPGENTSCSLSSGNYLATSAEIDPGELAQARAKIQNMELARLLQQDEDGDMLLHLFVAQGLRPLAYAAAEMLRDCGQLDAKEHRGKTPLLVAAAANQPEIVKDLIMMGADINAVDQKGQTVLHFGATYGLPGVIGAVMMAGVSVNMEARNFEGLTPLHCAVLSHNTAFQAQGVEPTSQHRLQDLLFCIQLLLQLGADYKSQDLKSSKTVLHLAVQAANLPLIQFLLQLPDPQMFVNMKAHGNTALHMATGLHRHPLQKQIVHLLLHHWADPTARNLENEQPVHLLASGPATEEVRKIAYGNNGKISVCSLPFTISMLVTAILSMSTQIELNTLQAYAKERTGLEQGEQMKKLATNSHAIVTEMS